MDHILVSNIITEKINGASGREAFILSMDIINHWNKDFKLVVVLKDKISSAEEKKVFEPHFGGTDKATFSSAIIKIKPEQDLHFQLECSQPILGNLSYRFF